MAGDWEISASLAGKSNNLPSRFDNAVRRALILAAQRVVLRAVALQEQARPGTIASGRTIRAHSISPVRIGRDSAGSYMFVRVGPSTGYSRWGIETGRRPGTPPPLRRIYQWVIEKPFGQQLTEREAWRTARYVQSAIALAGTKPYHIMSRAVRIESPNVKRIIKASIKAAVRGR
jgi:hypothetical protein